MIGFSEKCTGCNACVQICPRECIQKKAYGLGFEYPEVDTDKCIGCNMCSTVCPVDKPHGKPTVQKAYAVTHRDSNIVSRSSSGGMFSAIADTVLEQGGAVYGCAFDEKIRACTVRISDRDELYRLCGSKYVQCDTNTAFVSAKKDLNEGRAVFFTGTPCQLDGLRNFLQKDYENLICADLICHGVPSAKYFADYLAYLEKQNNGQITDFNFRSKDNKGWTLSGYYCLRDSVTGKEKRKNLFYFENYYYSYFLSGDIYRESCYTCKYADLNRIGDFTLGDLWGAEGMKIPFDTENGCSLVLVNSKKGQELLERLDIECCEIPIEEAVKYNNQLREPSKRTQKRDEREAEYERDSAETIAKRFFVENRKANLMGRLKYAVPQGVKKRLLQHRYK